MTQGNVSERRTAQPDLGVTSVILALDPSTGERGRLWLPLVRRVNEPFRGRWALPGGPVRADRSLEHCAMESLADTTDLRPAYLEQLYTFGGPTRSAGAVPMVSICYWALVGQTDVSALQPRDNVHWFPEDELPDLAFDHARIVRYALWRLRHRMDTPDVVRQLVGEPFTLGQLHRVTEAVLGASVDLANFRRKSLASGRLEDTGQLLREGVRRPAALYRFRAQDDRHAVSGGLPHGWDISESMPLTEDGPDSDDALAALTTSPR
ncbi:NUDIX hydrolase [Bifidobacterium cuniculi]|uniref:NUDIX hydrolase n=1 Tax=Bifidobacterium cuniculi TaxID=1688 RepID=A0A087B3J9_9BIFI|nr:NUDIX domain-containing protein [Bifidobacterium cuniculi]KFI65599.1 NUDIX hydrolase [Bifidobacterium cuniculi]